MGKKFNIWLWILGILSAIGAFFAIKHKTETDQHIKELEDQARWHKKKDKEEQKRIDRINSEMKSRENVHQENKDRFSKSVSIILILVFLSAISGLDAKYIKEVDGELRDFGTQENYEKFLETEREDYQKDVEIRDRKIKLLEQNNSTKSNINAIQEEELKIYRRRDKPLVRFVEKVDGPVGVTIGFFLAWLSSQIYRNSK